MIQYSLDTDIRTKVVVGLALASVGLSTLYSSYISSTIVAPSVMGIFAGLFLLYDQFFWKLSLMHRFHGVTDLNGKWVGTLSRQNAESGEEETDMKISILISQTWSKMDISLVNDSPPLPNLPGHTASYTTAVNFQVEANQAKRLRYVFHFDMGYGTAELRLSETNESTFLKGKYISSIMNKGTIFVERKPENF